MPKLGPSFDKINGGNATVVAGCDMKCASNSGFAAAVAAAKSADTVILALGIDGDICGEGKDRMDIALPGEIHTSRQFLLQKSSYLLILLQVGRRNWLMQSLPWENQLW